jgi:hypothetical protein
MAVGLGTMREELTETSVDKLFTQGEAERLIARPKAQEDLEKIAKSERGDHRLRVLAHELLLLLGKDPDPKMVRIYCEAVPGAFMHNWWGLPGQKLGRLGQSLIRFGEAALPHLVTDFDDPDLIRYLGPEAAIVRERKYCVGDLMAYLACTILDRPFPDGNDPEARMAPRMQLRDELAAKLSSEKSERKAEAEEKKKERKKRRKV